MKHLFIIFIIIALLFSSCLGRTARSGGGLLSTPELEAQWGPDLNGNGLPDALEDAVREANGLGPNEPVSAELAQQYLDALAANNANQAGEWTPADITAMTGLGTELLTSLVSAGLSYAGQKAQSQAEVDKWAQFNKNNKAGQVNFSVAPYGQGNLVAMDKGKLGVATYSAAGGTSIMFEKITDGQNTASYTWNETPGVYSIQTEGGYINLMYSTSNSNSLFNGLYTTNVTRCCKNSTSLNKWIEGDGSQQGIENYIITEVRLSYQTSSAVKNETYTRLSADAECQKVACKEDAVASGTPVF